MNGVGMLISGSSNVTSLPGGLVLLAASVAAVAIVILVARASSFRLPLLVLIVTGLLVVAYALLVLHQRQIQTQALAGAADALLARAAALDAALATTGLACLDALPENTDACAAVVFASPDKVHAARALLRARLLVLADGVSLQGRLVRPALSQQIEAWRRSLAADPYGLVALVLREDFGCADANCPAAAVLTSRDAVAARFADKRFESLIARYQAPPAPIEPARPAEPAPVSIPPAPMDTAVPEPPADAGSVPTDAPAIEGVEPRVPTADMPLPPPRPAITSRPRPAPPPRRVTAEPPPAAAAPEAEPAPQQ